jgi:hypothetical protein
VQDPLQELTPLATWTLLSVTVTGALASASVMVTTTGP